MDIAGVIRARRAELGLSQARLAREAGVSPRQLARYEAGEQQPVLTAAVNLADALGISLAQLAGQASHDLSGTWWCAWQTSQDESPRIDVRGLKVLQHGDLLQLDAERTPEASGRSHAWRGELRLWDDEVLIGWYRTTDATDRSGGSLFLALHQHATYAWGRWTGMSHDGQVITGWAVMARTGEQARDVTQHLIDSGTTDDDAP